MTAAPSMIGGEVVICYTLIDDRHRLTGNCDCHQRIARGVRGSAAGLVICQYQGQDGFYLFGCDDQWRTITDTWHQTVDEAKDQAEFEYAGVSHTWAYPTAASTPAAD